MAERIDIAKRLEGLTFAQCLAHFSDQVSQRDECYIAKAREQYESEGSIEIDDHTIVSELDDRVDGDDGAYVLAWLWVYDD